MVAHNVTFLAGLVERVTYQNAENGFCVIRTSRSDGLGGVFMMPGVWRSII
jgi:hypothetical protein